ncbi:MAG: M15 family metallopeptidase [Oscillospiraceae bacterium]|nr:M15 family metallopeptidase [Oscillospiraceae bacterium]
MHKKLSLIRRALPLIILLSLLPGLCGASNQTKESPSPPVYSSAGSSDPLREADLLILVNYENSLDMYYYPILTYHTEEFSLDRRAMGDFVELIKACREAGGDPYIVSAYRSYYKQLELYEAKVLKLIKAGRSEEQARIEAARSVAVPGTSEHQLGLAVDIVDVNYGYLNEFQAYTPTQKWLMKNSWRYGFILRYPVDKSEITGIIYEPWHYRYVGKEAAQDIYESGLCFEEWLEEKALEIQSRHPKNFLNKWEISPERI